MIRQGIMNFVPIIILLIGSECLQLYRVVVPPYKRQGENAELHCQFDLGEDTLYAVKWYKDNEEFFRYMPRFNPFIRTHPVEGVHVVERSSSAETVVLRSVVVRSTGLYRCEVSAEAPSFTSSSGEGRMTVMYLPKEGPQISGNLREEYEVGDTLDLNCTSSKSFPPAKISWYINDLPVMGHPELTYYDSSVELSHPYNYYSHLNSNSFSAANSPVASGGHQLIRSTSRRLLLTLTPSHFGSRGTAKVRCVARIFPLFWQDGDEKNIDHKNGPKNSRNNHLSKDYNRVQQHRHQVQQNKLYSSHSGSLYKGEALVQIRGGGGSLVALSSPTLFAIILLALTIK